MMTYVFRREEILHHINYIVNATNYGSRLTAAYVVLKQKKGLFAAFNYYRRYHCLLMIDNRLLMIPFKTIAFCIIYQ